MAKVYSKVKGAQGIAPGVIVPFSRECQTDTEREQRVPGGYLRCDGRVYQARDYPSLARVIGVGSTGGGSVGGCKFPPGLSGTTLLNPSFDADGNFTGGTFAVPNLGCKVLVPSSIAGQQFVGNTRMSGSGIYERAGIGYRAIIQSVANSSFNGSINESSYTSSMSGTPSLSVSGQTVSTASLSQSNIAGHDHNFQWRESDVREVGVDTNLQDNVTIDLSGVLVETFPIEHNGADVVHNHTLSGSGISQNLSFTRDPVTISFAGSTAQANVLADSRESLDHVTTPYMIVEYIIKF